MSGVMDDDADLKYWLAFNRITGIGRVRFGLLEKHFGALENAWLADASDLKAAGLDGRTISAIVQARPDISPDGEQEQLQRLDVRALTWHDPSYPRLLNEIADPPPVLYVRGQLAASDDMAVAVVGTRRPTAYGRQCAEELSAELARAGVTVISGLARGVDAIAHNTTLKSGGRTIAVMASGANVIYPREHLHLSNEICASGALVTEYPPGTQPRGDFFPRRNRIMSGLARGVLIIEGDLQSGAMITARLAMEQNREVLAVPGSIFSPQSRGPNSLLQDGAKLVRNVEDVLEELNLTMVPQQVEARERISATDTEVA